MSLVPANSILTVAGGIKVDTKNLAMLNNLAVDAAIQNCDYHTALEALSKAFELCGALKADIHSGDETAIDSRIYHTLRAESPLVPNETSSGMLLLTTLFAVEFPSVEEEMAVGSNFLPVDTALLKSVILFNIGVISQICQPNEVAIPTIYDMASVALSDTKDSSWTMRLSISLLNNTAIWKHIVRGDNHGAQICLEQARRLLENKCGFFVDTATMSVVIANEGVLRSDE